jgi:hypothetical protein
MPTAVSATEGMAFNISDASKRMDPCKSREKSNVRKTSTAGTPATAWKTEVAELPETVGKSVIAGTCIGAWAQQQQGYKNSRGSMQRVNTPTVTSVTG